MLAKIRSPLTRTYTYFRGLHGYKTMNSSVTLPYTSRKMPSQLARQDIDWRYNARIAIIFGTSQIICGLLCVLLGGALVAVDAAYSKTAAGIWGGTLFVLAGSAAIWSAKSRTHRSIFACFVVSILATVCVLAILVVSGFGISASLEYMNDKSYYFHFERSEGPFGYPVLRYNQQILRASIAVYGLTIIVAMFEVVAAALQIVICRHRRSCCLTKSGRNGDLAVIYTPQRPTGTPSRGRGNKLRDRPIQNGYAVGIYDVEKSKQLQERTDKEFTDSTIVHDHSHSVISDETSVFTDDYDPGATSSAVPAGDQERYQRTQLVPKCLQN